MPETPPQHLAFIMDGNRRWAKARGKQVLAGHREGAEAFQRVVRACADRGVKFATFYTLSTENLERPAVELAGLFSLLREIPSHLGEILKEGVRLRTIGDLARLPADIQEMFAELETRTESHDRIIVTLAVAYGGRDEIVRAARKLAESGADFTEENLARNLDAPDIPEPEVIVRTGGRARTSNFLPWQAAYSEIYFSDKMWPDFTAADVDAVIAWLGETERTFGR